MDTVVDGGLEVIELPQVLRESALPDVQLSTKRIDSYSLVALRSEDDSYGAVGADCRWYREVRPDLRYDVWLAAPTGFALAYKGKPQAMVALGCIHQQELMIYQLQGIQAKIIDP